MRLQLRRSSEETGAATTEFALTTVILVPLLLYAIFFFEVMQAKLKANEASRYMVWEMTAYGLSDWQNGDHAKRFNDARSEILNELNQRYGDDLDGATPTIVPNYKALAQVATEISVDTGQNTMENVDPGIYSIGGFDTANDVMNYVFGWFKFNKMGKAKGTFKVHIKNKLLGSFALGRLAKMKLLDKQDIDISSVQSLVVDQWDLKSGQSVNEIGDHQCDSDYCKQIKRMHLAGVTGNFSEVASTLSKVGAAMGIHMPTEAVISSNALSGTSTADAYNALVEHVGEMTCHSHNPVNPDMNNLYKDRYKKEDSRYYKIYNMLGPCYMGCNQPLRQEAGTYKCKYDSRNTNTQCK